MKSLKGLECISFTLFILFACGIDKNIIFGIVAVLFILVFFLLTKLEESFHERKESHMRYINRNRYRDWETDRKSTRLNSSHRSLSRMPSSA